MWERVALGVLVVKHVPARLQLADIFTKSLPAEAFQSLRYKLGVDDPPTQSLRGVLEQSHRNQFKQNKGQFKQNIDVYLWVEKGSEKPRCILMLFRPIRSSARRQESPLMCMCISVSNGHLSQPKARYKTERWQLAVRQRECSKSSCQIPSQPFSIWHRWWHVSQSLGLSLSRVNMQSLVTLNLKRER